MPHQAMTPHVSGSTLSAQTRYAAGTREILECWFESRPIREEYLVVDGGKLAGVGATSYTLGKGPASRTIASKTRNVAKR
jgi:formate dehydrogenase